MFALRLALAVLFLSLAATAQPPAPERLDNPEFRDVVAVSGNIYIAGQPSEAALAQMKANGVTTVISLRTAREMDDREIVSFDEAATVADLGMRYVHIPLGGPENPYDEAALSRFSDAVAAAGDGKVLVHCTVGWRASHMWAAWLVKEQGMSVPDAVAYAEQVNFGTLPIESLLGRDLELDEVK